MATKKAVQEAPVEEETVKAETPAEQENPEIQEAPEEEEAPPTKKSMTARLDQAEKAMLNAAIGYIELQEQMQAKLDEYRQARTAMAEANGDAAAQGFRQRNMIYSFDFQNPATRKMLEERLKAIK